MIIILFLCFNLALANNYGAPEECELTSCDGVTNISYPFWLSNEQPSYCGYSSLEVNCDHYDDYAGSFLSFRDYKFEIRNISYENKSLLLDMESKYDDNPCEVAKYNISSQIFVDEKMPLRISSKNRQLYLFYNCSKPPPPDLTEMHPEYEVVDCNIDKVLIAHVGGEYTENPEVDKHMSEFGCETTTLPVQSNSTEQNLSANLLAFVNNGFVVEWSDCTQGCGERERVCRKDIPTDNSSCICPENKFFASCEINDKSAASPAPAPTDVPNKKGVSNLKTIYIVVGVVGGLLLITITVFFLVIYNRKRRDIKQQGSPVSQSQSDSSSNHSMKYDVEVAYSKSDLGTPIFTYQELDEATDGFNCSNELGEGGFGTVYKGNLKDGRIVAIKRLYKNNYKCVEQFRNEVEILSKLKHQNLVCLYGCTSRYGRELLLVYEFVPNGTVADHLHGHRAREGSLSWHIRMNIAIETADALHYLHAIKPQIIHRDVKTSNILLDNNFHVKVADFGLSRLFPLNATHVSTAPQGTPGYVDPEYYHCYRLTDKSDVYSFGVVLMELISSKPAVDIRRNRQDINLTTMATNMIVNNLLDQFVDPTVGYNSDKEIKRMIDMVAEVAFKCVQAERDMRPTIEEVLQALRAIQSDETVV